MSTNTFKFWWYKLLYRGVSSQPLRIISEEGAPYLERYYLTTFLKHRFYIHRFVASDPKTGFHDHPWSPAFSFVLWGEYGEERIAVSDKTFSQRGRIEPTTFSVQHRIVRWFNMLTRGVAHRVVILDDWMPLTDALGKDLTPSYKPVSKECWSLFIHPARYQTGWGFWTNVGLPNLYSWLSFSGHASTKIVTSGEWWKTAVKARLNPQRIKPLYKS